MNDREFIKQAAALAADKLATLIEDAGPLYVSALDMVQDLIQQAIDEAYTTRIEADRIEFVDLDRPTRVAK